MRTRLLCCVAAAVVTSCIKRISPNPPDERTTWSGVALPFGQPGEIPPDSKVIWDFGDGTPPVTGQNVRHAFGRAGVYTIVETIQDKDGQTRTARTHVAALLRTLPMAVPGDVKAVLMLPTPWNKVQLHREIAGKLALGTFFDDVARTVSEGAGFDALDPNAAAASGFDPAKGAAFFTVPQDPEALVLAVGTIDDAKSFEAAKRLLSSPRAVGRYGGGAFQLTDGKLPDGTPLLVGQNAAGDKVAVLQRYGYLYLRTAGASDPALSLQSAAALPPDKGLAVDKGFLNASRHTGAGDAIFYSRAADGMRFSQELSSSAFALIEKPEVLQFRIFTTLKNLSGDELAASSKPLAEPPDLASKLPAGASAYLRLSAAPETLWRELSRLSGSDAARLHDRMQEITGLDVEKDLIPSFSGNVGIAVYLDASALIEAIMGEDVGSFDKSAFVMAAQLTKADVVQAALERAVKARIAAEQAAGAAKTADLLTYAGTTVYRLGDAAHAAVKDGILFLAVGGTPPPPPAPEPTKKRKAVTAPKKTPTLADLGILAHVLQERGSSLSQEFKHIGVAGFQVPGQQNFWVNLAGIVRSLESAGAEEGGVASSGARLFADRAAYLRDALFEARPSKEGVDADLWLRFLSKTAK